jgi:hypothetical protein
MSQTQDSDETDPSKQYLVPPELAMHLEISDDLLMDFGVIPDTRPPLPPPSLRTRWRWRIADLRAGVARRAYKLIAGYDPHDDDD